MGKLERVLRDFPAVARRVTAAANESLEVAHADRAATRRERMVTRSNSQIPTLPRRAKLEMPEEWRDDEDTAKITVPPKE